VDQSSAGRPQPGDAEIVQGGQAGSGIYNVHAEFRGFALAWDLATLTPMQNQAVNIFGLPVSILLPECAGTRTPASED